MDRDFRLHRLSDVIDLDAIFLFGVDIEQSYPLAVDAEFKLFFL